MTEWPWLEGPEIGVKDMLLARDRRVQRREEVLARSRLPTLTLTVVMPGPIKMCPMSQTIASEANRLVRERFSSLGWVFHPLWDIEAPTGPEALYGVDCEADALKRAMVELEENHALGRMWDLDVHGSDGKAIARRNLGLAPRQCLLCDEPAHACARSRRHGVGEILAHIQHMVTQWQDLRE